MTDSHDDLQPDQAPIDALLRERVGSDAPPDLTQAIVARHARGEGARAAERIGSTPETSRPMARPLLAAAMVLLGVGAVAGTIWSTQPSDDDDRGAAQAVQQPALQDPKPENAKPQDPKKAPGKKAPGKKDANKGFVEVPLHQFDNPLREPGPESFRLRVVDEKGGPIQEFRVQVLTATANPDLLVQRDNMPKERYGVIQSLRNLHKHPRDFDGDFTRIEGLWPGRYVVAVTDRMHAKTISDVFVVGGKDDVELVVRMNRGGRVRGVVVDADGKPVPGAEVESSPQPMYPSIGKEHAFAKMMQLRAPKLQTRKTVRTRADGSFDLDRLTFGDYTLRARHIEFCGAERGRVRVTAKGDVQLTFRLEPGAIVHGVVRKDGKPQAGVAVQIVRLHENGSTERSWRVRSDAEGRYRMSARLRAGSYKITGFVEGGDVENPFEKILQMKQSTLVFDVPEGKREVARDLDLK